MTNVAPSQGIREAIAAVLAEGQGIVDSYFGASYPNVLEYLAREQPVSSDPPSFLGCPAAGHAPNRVKSTQAMAISFATLALS
jgi:hypothetical protein